MEYETVKQKEKKISVKISRGSIWEDVKERLEEQVQDKQVQDDDKKAAKKKLVVDVNVKREFRGEIKDEGWMGKIKSVLSRNKGHEKLEMGSDKLKKEQLEREKNKEQKSKANDKDKDKDQPKNNQETRKRQESGVKKSREPSKSKNRVTDNDEDREKNALTKHRTRTQITDAHSKEHHKSKDHSSKNQLRGLSRENDKIISKDRVKSKHRSSKPECNKNEEEDGVCLKVNPISKEILPKFDENKEETPKRKSMASEKRSRSKPGTVKEKLKTESTPLPSVKNFKGSSNSAIKCLRNLKSSIISLRAIDKNSKEEKRSRSRKELRRKQALLEKGGQGDEDTRTLEETPSPKNDQEGKLQVLNEDAIMDIPFLDQTQSKSNVGNVSDKSIVDKTNKRLKEKRHVTLDSNTSKMDECLDLYQTERSRTDVLDENLRFVDELTAIGEASRQKQRNDLDQFKRTGVMKEMSVVSEEPVYSSSSYSSSSGDHICSCGCMESRHQICQNKSGSSASSCSSIEYLRSYSGNLVMCANGKKTILTDHIRYLSSCLEL